MNRILFSNVQIIDCSAAEPFSGEVLIEGNRIAAVAGRDAPLPRDNVQLIDGGGKTYLMPGLIESHAHLSIDNVEDLAKIAERVELLRSW